MNKEDISVLADELEERGFNSDSMRILIAELGRRLGMEVTDNGSYCVNALRQIRERNSGSIKIEYIYKKYIWPKLVEAVELYSNYKSIIELRIPYVKLGNLFINAYNAYFNRASLCTFLEHRGFEAVDYYQHPYVSCNDVTESPDMGHIYIRWYC